MYSDKSAWRIYFFKFRIKLYFHFLKNWKISCIVITIHRVITWLILYIHCCPKSTGQTQNANLLTQMLIVSTQKKVAQTAGVANWFFTNGTASRYDVTLMSQMFTTINQNVISFILLIHIIHIIIHNSYTF